MDVPLLLGREMGKGVSGVVFFHQKGFSFIRNQRVSTHKSFEAQFLYG